MYTPIIPGGFCYRSLLSFFEHQAHNICVLLSYVPFTHHYMHLYDLSFGQAGLPGSYAYPTFPIVRLGGKGSTSAIVTAGSARRVPRTGWSRKLAFLREYSVGEQKMASIYYPYLPPDVFNALLVAVRTCTLGHAYPGKGTLNGTILSGRCFLLPM